MPNAIEVLKSIRAKQGLTQKDFAERIGMKQSAYAMIELGKNRASLDLLNRLKDVFNIDTNVFFVENAVDFSSSNLNDSNITNDDIENHKNGEVVKSPIQERHRNIFWKSKELKENFDKRFKRDLHSKERELFEVLQLIENTGAIIQVLNAVHLQIVDGRPNPFYDFSSAYSLVEDGRSPEDVEYKDFKLETINWLKKVAQYESSIETLYNAIDTFLQEIKPLDVDNLYEW